MVIQDGDEIELDTDKHLLQLNVSEEEIAKKELHGEPVQK